MINDVNIKTILIVDNDEEVSKVISKILIKAGYRTIIVNSGESAVETALNNRDINLILMDINLGDGIDGAEAARRISLKSDIPIVFHTSHPEQEVVEKVQGITRYGYVIKSSGSYVLQSSIELALDLFEATKKTVKSEKLFRGLFEKSLNAIALIELIYDEQSRIRDGIIIAINPVFEKATGLKNDDIKGRLYTEVNPSVLKTDNIRKLDEVLRRGEPYISEGFYPPMNKYFNFSAHEIEKGLVAIIMEDITAQKRDRESAIENEIKLKSFQLLHQVTDNIPACIACVKAYDLTYEFVNEVYASTFCFSTTELIGMCMKDVVGEDAYSCALPFIERACLGEMVSHESRIPTNAGLRYFKVDVIPQLDESNFVKYLIILAIDITERKLSDEKILNLLKEKEILIKEVHHRIKNNMSTISGILFLQSDAMHDSSAIAALNDAQSRVHSMMVLYDKLYRSDSFIEMPIIDYLNPLIDEIICGFPNSQKVKIEKRIDTFIIDSTLLFPLGIIVNELLTNIMKYAFPDGTPGHIIVSASVINDNAIIVIEDNGSGLPENIDINNSNGFGLCLVGILTEQLKGSIKIERINGTRFILEFKV